MIAWIKKCGPAIAGLVLLNLAAHFMPFERAALAPDDYTSLFSSQRLNMRDIPRAMLKIADRPLNYAVLMLQSKLVGDNAFIAFLLLIISSVLVLIAVYYLFNQLFGDEFTAFITSAIYCLLPNKLELYHTLIFFNMNIAIFLYILCLALFIAFAKNSRIPVLFTSILAYTTGIFWYEVGFFTPFVMIAYAYLKKPDKIKYALYFLIPAVIYALYRLTGAFGLTGTKIASHAVVFSALPLNQIADLAHQYFGRYMIRDILYGAYKFLSIENIWRAFIIIADIIVLVALARRSNNKRLEKVEPKLTIFSLVIIICFLMPNLLNAGGGIGGRHLALPSIGVCILLIWILGSANEKWRIVFLTSAAALLVICQGNAWSQVVACRINRAVYENIKDRKVELLKADNIIIDTKSFANNIPFTFIQRDFNVLNTYYGAQAFEDWGLRGMIKLAIGDVNKPVYIATDTLRNLKGGSIEFAVSSYQGYRSVSKNIVAVPQKGSLIIDFKGVYSKGFKNGLADRAL